MPQKTCESLSSFKGDGITTIQARVVAATADTPQHCRVTGIITPEVAFEVNLPERWNRRFYMTGNGGLAGDPVDQPNNPDRTGGAQQRVRHGAHEHRARLAEGAERVVHPQQSAEGDRLRLPRGARDRGDGEEDRHRLLLDSRSRSRTGTRARTAAVRVCSRRSAIRTTSTASSPTRRGSIRPASRWARCGIRRR